MKKNVSDTAEKQKNAGIDIVSDGETSKIWGDNEKAVDCVCTYDGNIYALKNGTRKKLHLENLHPPFKTRYQIIT